MYFILHSPYFSCSPSLFLPCPCSSLLRSCWFLLVLLHRSSFIIPCSPLFLLVLLHCSSFILSCSPLFLFVHPSFLLVPPCSSLFSFIVPPSFSLVFPCSPLFPPCSSLFSFIVPPSFSLVLPCSPLFSLVPPSFLLRSSFVPPSCPSLYPLSSSVPSTSIFCDVWDNPDHFLNNHNFNFTFYKFILERYDNMYRFY